ncbi:MAG TPA: PEP-CTERM sorting domain-containing protein [bacterium]|nr:PEP-CTERM sorting domain-containing protein [bacterium]
MNRGALMILFLVIASFAASWGDTISFEGSVEFGGAYPPAGPAPWLTATLTDLSGDQVQLLLETNGLIANEFVSHWFFNLNPDFDPLNLIIEQQSGPIADIRLGSNAFRADGDGYYDIVFDWVAQAFSAQQTAVFNLSGLSGLSVYDFEFIDAGGGKGDFLMAAHVQGVGAEGELSGWVGTPHTVPGPNIVPEPTSILLFSLGVCLITAKRSRLA